MLARLRDWARLVKRDIVAIWLAAGDPRVPWYAKALAAAIAAYALSPIDLIPDFIPVLGLLDDLILLPLGIALVAWMIPPPVLAELRVLADAATAQPRSFAGAIAVIAVWTALTALACWYAYRWLAGL
jgi:uncharacterized membrane protein YkvA (DUF1232 family)